MITPEVLKAFGNHIDIKKVAEATLKMDSGSNILKPEKKIKTGMPGHVKKPTIVQTEV